jgi:hypothetical protein
MYSVAPTKILMSGYLKQNLYSINIALAAAANPALFYFQMPWFFFNVRSLLLYYTSEKMNEGRVKRLACLDY